jgi:hypothetical protein
LAALSERKLKVSSARKLTGLREFFRYLVAALDTINLSSNPGGRTKTCVFTRRQLSEPMPVYELPTFQ